MRPSRPLPAPRWPADAVAGVSVALVLIPQAMAYAELAGMPAHRGLIAAALPPIAAALFASSPYLQTGPVALTSLLTFGALSSMAVPGSEEYVLLGCLLAVLVGLARIGIGLFRGGPVSYLMSRPVMRGFLAAAALLIVASQVPSLVGAAPGGGDLISGAWRALSSPGAWDPETVGLSAATLALVAGGRRIHRFFPGILLAVLGGIVYSRAAGYGGAVVGGLPGSILPEFHLLDLPLGRLPELAVSGAIIALVGFADTLTISQAYAEQTRRPWDPDREFLSQGAANLVAGLSGGFPVGGSIGRTAVNRRSGARTRASGAFTGAAVLLFLPFAGAVAPLPRAVLGAIVVGAVARLMDPRPLLSLWRMARLQAALGITTSVLTLALAPRVEYAVVGGVAFSLAVHVWREQRVEVEAAVEDGVLVLRPMGVIWFGSAPLFRQALARELSEHRKANRVVLDLSALGRIDLTGAMALREVVETAREVGLEVRIGGVPPHAERIIASVCAGLPGVPGGTGEPGGPAA